MPVFQRSYRAINNAGNELIESEIFGNDISDEALEAAGLSNNPRAGVTQFAHCTWGLCLWTEEA
jgi:hypothetical protein